MLVIWASPRAAGEASGPCVETWGASDPGGSAEVTGLLVAADSLYARAALYACGHCDTTGHGPCSYRRGVGPPLLVPGIALGPTHCLAIAAAASEHSSCQVLVPEVKGAFAKFAATHVKMV